MHNHIHRVKLEPIHSLADALQVRSIRNECRDFMTRDTSVIGLFRQIKWYYKNYKKSKTLIVYLARIIDTDEVVGYGLITTADKNPLLSGGLKKKFRGYGLGTELFLHLTEEAEDLLTPKQHVALEVLSTNLVARFLYRKLGFKELSWSKDVIYMEKL